MENRKVEKYIMEMNNRAHPTLKKQNDVILPQRKLWNVRCKTNSSFNLPNEKPVVCPFRPQFHPF